MVKSNDINRIQTIKNLRFRCIWHLFSYLLAWQEATTNSVVKKILNSWKLISAWLLNTTDTLKHEFRCNFESSIDINFYLQLDTASSIICRSRWFGMYDFNVQNFYYDLNTLIQIQLWIIDETYDFSSSAAWEAGKRSKVWIFAMDPAVMDTMKLLKLLLFWVELFIARKILWEPCFWNPRWIGQARKRIMFTRHYIGRKND